MSSLTSVRKKLIFIDETGLNTKMARIRGRLAPNRHNNVHGSRRRHERRGLLGLC